MPSKRSADWADIILTGLLAIAGVIWIARGMVVEGVLVFVWIKLDQIRAQLSLAHRRGKL